MFTIEEVKKLVAAELAHSGLTTEDADLEVWLDSVTHPTFDVVDGETVMRVGEDEETLVHSIQTINFKRHDTLGRAVTCSIALATGEGSPHTFTERTPAEVEALIAAQVGAVLHESLKKPRTAAEHADWEARTRAAAAAREEAAYLAHLAEQRALMTDEQRAHHDYVLEHKEPPYVEGSLEKAAKLAPALVRSGHATAEEAARELARLAAWKARHEAR